MKNRFKGIHLRSLLHYTGAVAVMTLYGGQVCPLVESLELGQWSVQLCLIFFPVYLFRTATLPLLRHIDLGRQASGQFVIELFWLVAAGTAVAGINNIIYGFPGIESGLKMILGTTALGFFMAADMALAWERLIDLRLTREGNHVSIPPQALPLSLKFIIAAALASIFVSAVILLVVLKDLGWMTGVEIIDIESARIAVIKEITFVTLVFLVYLFNLILSYAKNLNLAVTKENRALIRVSQGQLDTRVTVSSRDEFGIMAQYTNQMIETLEKKTRDIRQTRDATIIALAGLAETRDNETGDHILRTQNYVRALAEQLKSHPDYSSFLNRESIDLFYKSAPLHDIGKVGIPDSILLKPGKLTSDEFDIMKQHTVLGRDALEKAADNLKANNFLAIAQEIAFSHHEKWDGTGYPLGLKKEKIPLSARLMALADVYDALISKRVYKEAFTHEKAKTIIIEGKGSHFDPNVVTAFLDIEQTFIGIAARYN